ncbi:MAG: discoidin domain-containing protein [Lentisphaeria bacterium]|nr:discoidin domain-containing protein [Lentisphaeria bacterium]
MEHGKFWMGLLAGAAALPLLALPASDDFENDAPSRWSRIDGTYWQLTGSAASGKTAVQRALYKSPKAAARPALLTSSRKFSVKKAFDGAVRVSLSGKEDTPVKMQILMQFFDSSGKLIKENPYPLTPGFQGRYVRNVFRVEPPAGAVECRPVLSVYAAAPLMQMVFARFDDLDFGEKLSPEPAVRIADDTLDLQAPKLDLTFDHGAAGWAGIDGKRWRLTGSSQAGKYALRFFSDACKTLPQDVLIRSVVPVPVRGGAQYRFEARIRNSHINIARATAKLIWLDAAGKKLGQSVIPPQFSPFGRFSVMSGLVQTPAAATMANVELGAAFVNIPVKSYTLDFDSLQLNLWQDPKPAVPPYSFKMASPDAGKWTPGNLSIGKFYQANRPPFRAYVDSAPNAWTLGSRLTDGLRGAVKNFEKFAYVGWRGQEDVVLTLDLGRVQKAETLKITGRRDHEAYYAVPKAWRAEVSTDGKTYSPWLSGEGKEVPDGMFTLEGKAAQVSARYIRITLTPGGGKNALTMIDEMEVTGMIKNTWKMVPENGVYHGAFPPTYGFKEPWRKGRKAPMSLETFENLVGKKLSMVLWYQGMSPERNFSELQDLLNMDLMERSAGPRFISNGWLPPAAVRLEKIAAGEFDEYFITYFRDMMDPAKTLNNRAPIWLRPMNEFNSGWVDWGFEPAAFLAAWRRIYNIAEQIGAAEHHIFLWSPNHRSYPDVEWNKMERYYPGDQYVDWVGLSCYPPSRQYVRSEGDRYPIGRCREVYEKYGDRKPMMVAEGGFDSPDRMDRVRWVKEWFEVPEKYPNFKAMIWENHGTRVLQDSGEPLELYKKLVQSPKWIGELYKEEAGK